MAGKWAPWGRREAGKTPSLQFVPFPDFCFNLSFTPPSLFASLILLFRKKQRKYCKCFLSYCGNHMFCNRDFFCFKSILIRLFPLFPNHKQELMPECYRKLSIYPVVEKLMVEVYMKQQQQGAIISWVCMANLNRWGEVCVKEGRPKMICSNKPMVATLTGFISKCFCTNMYTLNKSYVNRPCT